MDNFPQIKLLTIQTVSNTVAYLFDRSTEAGHFWFPPHVAIYAVKESANAPQKFIYVYLDNCQTCFSEIVTGFNTEDPSLPFVRLASQSNNTEVCATNVVNREDFKILLRSVQLSHNGADYVPEIEIQKCCAETIREDIDFLKEQLSLHGVVISKDVDVYCKDAITMADEFLEMWNREL